VRYTASNSVRRTSLIFRGNFCSTAMGGSAGANSPALGGKFMTALLAARSQHFAPAFRFHARPESVSLGAAALPRLKCTLWQNNSPYSISSFNAAQLASAKFPRHPCRCRALTRPTSPR
jgi:hypothetical protein